jgi:hypothetical protein
LVLLIAIAVVSVAAAATVRASESLQRHLAEHALLEVGEDFRRAFVRYRQGRPEAMCPSDLQDLLRDPRFSSPRRYLRSIPIDPLTGRATWGLVRNSAGQIAGVHSLAEGRPLKRAEFAAGLEGFASAKGYDEWVFGACGLETRMNAAGPLANRQ